MLQSSQALLMALGIFDAFEGGRHHGCRKSAVQHCCISRQSIWRQMISPCTRKQLYVTVGLTQQSVLCRQQADAVYCRRHIHQLGAFEGTTLQQQDKA